MITVALFKDVLTTNRNYMNVNTVFSEESYNFKIKFEELISLMLLPVACCSPAMFSWLII